MISVHFQDKPLDITGIQIYAQTTNTKETEVEQFYEDLGKYTQKNYTKKIFMTQIITMIWSLN